MHQLVMPDAFAGARVERYERVAEQVVARTIAAVEIEARAAEADERDPPLLVDGGLAPVVNAAGLLVGLWRPRVVPEFAGMGDAVEDPLNPAGAHVVRLHIGRRRVVARPLRRQRDDHRVLEDAARVARVQRLRRRPVAIRRSTRPLSPKPRIGSPLCALTAVR